MYNSITGALILDHYISTENRSGFIEKKINISTSQVEFTIEWRKERYSTSTLHINTQLFKWKWVDIPVGEWGKSNVTVSLQDGINEVSITLYNNK